LPEVDYRAEAQAGAWAGLGDPATDTMLVEIESAWVRARPQVHDAIERAIRSAVVDALRTSLGTRLRIEQEARATLDRIAADRNRLIDEVESLRRDAHGLQTELAELRRSLNELERERQIAQERRQQMFADAEAHRAQLLREIEQLGGQLDSMRQNIVSLLNMSSTVPAQLASLTEGLEEKKPPATRVAANGPGTTEVRIAGVDSLGKNLQIQQAIKALPGVTLEGQPRYRNGTITATLRHPPDFDVADALGTLPDQPLSLTGSPEPGVLELAAT
jgi:prefoldin subunit 5